MAEQWPHDGTMRPRRDIGRHDVMILMARQDCLQGRLPRSIFEVAEKWPHDGTIRPRRDIGRQDVMIAGAW